MSGICGVVTYDGSAVDPTEVTAMAAAAPYRGGHGTRAWFSAQAVLVQQASGHPWRPCPPTQPVELGGVVVVADARIDNRPELIPTLSASGYLPDAHKPSDAELILAAFRKWGETCPRRIIGDFAFVIWDTRTRRLFAARDPMGMRPLYVHSQARRRILVASEIKQLLAAPTVPCAIFEPAIATTLAGPYTPPSWTAYQEIEQIPPGHALIVSESGSSTHRYWQPDPDTTIGDVDGDVAAAMFRSAFAEAVRARLERAQTAGLLLSGGLDSGSLASMAGWLRENGAFRQAPQIRTYSWAFADLPDSDERGVSKHIVDRYGLAGIDVDADDGWPLAGYPEHGPDRDDPYCWVYQALIERTLACCRADGVDTQLTGDRGDELTGDWVYDEVGLMLAGRLRDALGDLRLAAEGSGLSALRSLRRRVIRPIVTTRWPRLAVALTRKRHPQQLWPPWVRNEFADRVDLGDIIRDMTAPPPVGGAALRQRHQRLFLSQGARIAVLRNRTRAKFGMDFADPYADRRLVELILAMPQSLVQRRGQPKDVVRRAMSGVVPAPALATARKTIPYGLFHRGFRERAVGTVHDLLTSSEAAEHGWLDEKQALAVFDGYRRTVDAAWDFWWPLTVEMWLRRWWREGR